MNKFRIFLARLNNVSMKKKLLISYVFVGFLPVLIVGLILTNGMRNMALNQATNEAGVNVDRIEQRMEEVFKLATDISNKTYTDQNLIGILEKKYSSTFEIFNDYKGYKEFDEYVNIYPEEIKNIRVYSFNSTMLSNGGFIKATKEVENTLWFQNSIKNNGRISWDYMLNELKNSHNLSLARLIKNISGNPLGILVIDINYEYFRSFLADEHFETIVINSYDIIVAAEDTRLIGTKFDIPGAGKSPDGKTRLILPVTYKNKPSMSIVRNFSPEYSDSRFKIISIFATDTIFSEPNKISILGFSIMGISIILSMILIYVFATVLNKRTELLCDNIDNVNFGNFDVSITIEGRDEIGQLSESIRFMLKRIKELIHEVYEVNLQRKQLIIEQKEIKLRMLANQINPHFLFNVLETIRSKAQRNSDKEVVEIVKLLSKILRRNLEINNEIIPLTMEFDLVKSYLEIQKYRFGNRINYDISINNDIDDFKILPLIIQPVVENSIIHGLERKVGSGKIFIEVGITGSFLMISVSDDGIGMEEDRLNTILQSLNEQVPEKNVRIGLRNVHQRIKLYYGERYGLKIASKPNEGTRVDILLPEGGDTTAAIIDN